MRGDHPDKVARAISKAMDSDLKNTKRLVRTESAAILNKAQIDCYKDLGISQLKIIGTLDSVTCSLCGGFDGSVIDEKEAKPGITTPPYHPNCRCCTEPYDPDWEGLEGETRIARDKDGNAYYVPAGMPYEEWKARFVDGTKGNDDLEAITDEFSSNAYRTKVSVEKHFTNGIIITKLSNGNVLNPMDRNDYFRISENLKKNGIIVLEAEASYGNGYIMHQGEIPSKSALIEEIIHSTQSRIYGEFDSSDPIELYAREVSANRKLLRYSKAYGFDEIDVADIKTNLARWEKKFVESVGKTYDEIPELHR